MKKPSFFFIFVLRAIAQHFEVLQLCRIQLIILSHTNFVGQQISVRIHYHRHKMGCLPNRKVRWASELESPSFVCCLLHCAFAYAYDNLLRTLSFSSRSFALLWWQPLQAVAARETKNKQLCHTDILSCSRSICCTLSARKRHDTIRLFATVPCESWL